jgi:uroporphyrinogen-III synthase
MMLLAIRPEPGLSATIAAGKAAGLEIDGQPLFRIEPVDWSPPPQDSFDVILLGSANAIRHGGPHLRELVGKPVYAVGEKTAVAARAAGFEVARTGSGGLQSLLDSLDRKATSFLRLAGENHVSLELPVEYSMAVRVVYRSAPLPMPQSMIEPIAAGAVILLHSGEAASHFSKECERLAIDKSKICLACLAPRIAAATGEGWRSVGVASQVTESALLALARDMCHQ